MIKDVNVFLLFIIVFLAVGMMASAVYYVITFQKIKDQLLDANQELSNTKELLEKKRIELERVDFIKERGDDIIQKFEEQRDRLGELTKLFSNIEAAKKQLEDNVNDLNSQNKRLTNDNTNLKRDVNRVTKENRDLMAKIASGQCP